jgi:hypothetical protein
MDATTATLANYGWGTALRQQHALQMAGTYHLGAMLLRSGESPPEDVFPPDLFDAPESEYEAKARVFDGKADRWCRRALRLARLVEATHRRLRAHREDRDQQLGALRA